MPDDTQTGGQAPTGTQPQAGNAADPNHATQTQNASTPSQPGAEGSDAGKSGGTADSVKESGSPAEAELRAQLERIQKELADTRKEAAASRVKAKELDKLREDAENAKLSEQERLQKRADAAEAAIAKTRERIGRTELKLAAKDAGIIDADDAIVHLLGKLEYDDDGEPVGVAKLVEGLKASKPHLFGQAAGQSGTTASKATQQAASSGGATNPTRAGGPMIVTANQYLDKAFQQEFRTRHGMDIVTAVRAGKAQIV